MIMDYEKAYKEALVRAQALNDKFKDSILGKNIEFIFPELKESEGERIRKVLIHIVKGACSKYGIKYQGQGQEISEEKLLAWLEKQGEHTNFRNKIQIGDKVTRNKDGVLVNLSQLNRVAKKDEKQGEQKSTDKIQLGKKYKCIASPRYSTFMTGKIYKPEDKFLCSLMNFCSNCFEPIEDGEQEPVDKVEPKFKVGDWLTTGQKIRKIIAVGTGLYVMEKEDGTEVSLSVNYVEGNYHLWTIQDAKDGDVLSYRDGQWIFIYKGIVTEDTFKYYALLSEKGITVNDAAFSLLASCIIPATKEQRDTLMKAMADAGYTFDFDKKELKKIEQKYTPKHKVCDTIYYNSFGEVKSMVVANVVTDSTDNPMYEDKEGNAVFEKALIEQKPAWSEEDEKEFEQLLDILHANGYESFDIWLKSLKERYTWKPSNEQIEVLQHAIDSYSFPSTRNAIVLKSLYEELKKLREE